MDVDSRRPAGGIPTHKDGSKAERHEPEFARTDAGNAELFAHLHGDRLRYDHRRRRWLAWSGHWWTPDLDAEVVRLAKGSARHRYSQAASLDDLKECEAEARWAISSESRMRLDAVLNLARAEHPIADSGDRWDADPRVLGVANGVVDLRTGGLRAGRSDDRITQHSNAAFDPKAMCPRWESFLEEILGGDEELIDFIWRAVGYSLTGETKEHCVFVCYGNGANGKTTFLNTLRVVVGGYGHNMPFSTIEMSSRMGVPTDVADLAGKRLVTATETNERTRLNEARLKALSGGDPVTARHLYGNFFEFEPVAKFWLAVNHKPRVEDDSFGFWRRVRLIPFIRVFREKADKDLPWKLMEEASGILLWAVRGCLEWNRRGLEPPLAVRTATNEYQQESDPVAGFIADHCVVADGCNAAASALYKAYREWAEEQGLQSRETLSSVKFGRRMGERFSRRHTDQGNAYEGIGLKAEGFGSDLKGSESEASQNRRSSPTQTTLAKKIENPSDPSECSGGDDDLRCRARSLWVQAGRSAVKIDDCRRIVDGEKFLKRASAEDVQAFIAALEGTRA